jgi:hypothetical protein
VVDQMNLVESVHLSMWKCVFCDWNQMLENLELGMQVY